ncbi:hypothetical protein Tco_1497273 [Tanacetum coccineum]
MDVIDLEDDSIDAEILNSMSVSNEHFQTALGPTNSFAVLEVPICSCDDIGGLKNVKRELQESNEMNESQKLTERELETVSEQEFIRRLHKLKDEIKLLASSIFVDLNFDRIHTERP